MTKAIEGLYPRRVETKQLRANIKRLSELYRTHVSPEGEVASHVLDLLSKMEVFSQGYYHMGPPTEPTTSNGMVSVLKVERVTISVGSLVEAMNFWVDALGSRVIAVSTEKSSGEPHRLHGSVLSAVVQLGGQTIELLEDRPAPPGIVRQPTNEVSISFSFNVTDLETPRARLTTHGWQVREIAMQPNVGPAFCAFGPDGCSVRFFQSS